MKILNVFLIVLSFAITASAQSISVLSNQPVTSLSDGQFYFPKSNPDGSKIFFTSTNYKGLWYYNTGSKVIRNINKYPGAGYEFKFSSDGNEILFRRVKYVNKRKYTSLETIDLQEQKVSVLIPVARKLKVIDFTDAGAFVRVGNKTKLFSFQNVKLKKAIASKKTSVDIENRNIVIYRNGIRKELQPLGKGIYLWPSISPDGTKLLFTLGGKGTYISDLEGNILTEIGYANYPSWSPDGKWILFMKDKDNGYNFTASDLFIIKSDGSKELQLTSSDNVIELYPSWMPDNKEIVYNTDSGVIYLMKFKISY